MRDKTLCCIHVFAAIICNGLDAVYVTPLVSSPFALSSSTTTAASISLPTEIGTAQTAEEGQTMQVSNNNDRELLDHNLRVAYLLLREV